MKRALTATAAALMMLSVSAPPASAQVGLFQRVVEARAREARRAESAVIVDQHGERNAAAVIQFGRGNRGRVTQRGDDNVAVLQQTGDNNTARVRQIGSGHTAAVTQTGDNNSACVLQVGRNTNAALTQTGGQNQTVLVTRAGAREVNSPGLTRLCNR